jgi:hypothetical protein
MYGMEELPPEVKKHFNIKTFSLEPLGWLHQILGYSVVDELYKKFWLKSTSHSDDALLDYLNATFNPLLNQKLNRQFDHPTFRDMLEHCYIPHVMKDPALSKKVKDEFLLRIQKRKKRQKI